MVGEANPYAATALPCRRASGSQAIQVDGGHGVSHIVREIAAIVGVAKNRRKGNIAGGNHVAATQIEPVDPGPVLPEITCLVRMSCHFLTPVSLRTTKMVFV